MLDKTARVDDNEDVDRPSYRKKNFDVRIEGKRTCECTASSTNDRTA